LLNGGSSFPPDSNKITLEVTSVSLN